jgi:hypothetical protein
MAETDPAVRDLLYRLEVRPLDLGIPPVVKHPPLRPDVPEGARRQGSPRGELGGSISTPVTQGAPGDEERVTILFLGANPREQTRLFLDQEVHDIDLALRQSKFRDFFELRQQFAVRVTEVQSLLLRYQPHILHFSGHGGPSGLYFESPTGSSSGRPVSGSALSRMLAQFQPRLACVVLNACYSVEQAQAIAENVDCVVGVSERISDRAAILFSSAFYQALAYGCNVPTACELGRSQIELAGLPGDDTIKLHARRAVSFVKS